MSAPAEDRASARPQASAPTFQAIGTALAYDSGAGDGPLQLGSARALTLAGLPLSAHSALVVLTVRGAKARGEITVRRTPTGGAVARLGFRAPGVTSLIRLLPVTHGQLFLKDSKDSSVDVRVDLLGYDVGAVPAKAKGRPAVALANGRWVAGSPGRTVAVARQHGAPGAKKLVAALLRISTRKAGASGGVQVYPTGGTPASPVAPIVTGHPTSTVALVPTGRNGQLSIAVTASARVRVDLIGYVTDTDAPAPTEPPEPAPPPAATPPTPAPAPPPVGPQPLAQVQAETGAAGAAAVAVQYAMSKVGDRYVAGGAGPDAFDCSGLTMASWAAAGVKLAHLSYTQYDRSQHIALADIQPGDLLFYFVGGAHHVAMYIGNGQMVNAANPASGVVLSGVNEAWYMKHLTGVGRVVGP